MLGRYSRSGQLCRLVVLVIGLGAFTQAPAATRTWDGGGDGTNWFSDNNWNPDGVPQPGDSATVDTAATVYLTNSTPILDTFTLTNAASLVFSSNTNAALQATNVLILNGATVTHNIIGPIATNAAGNWVPDSRVWILCSNLTVGLGGKINTDSKGYKGGYNPGPRLNGAGPGGGTNEWVGSGAGYGGAGGASHLKLGAGTYGSASNPDDPGSGSGGRDGAGTGSNGGGWIRIAATGQVTLDGSVTAHGGGLVSSYGGGGSGGGICIQCDTLTGSGFIGASGGATASDGSAISGGGGGGRIAVLYNPTAQSNVNLTAKPTLQIAANNGWAHNGSTHVEENAYPRDNAYRRFSGGLGTIYLSDDSFFPPPFCQGGEVIIPGGMNASLNSLTISNGILSLPSGATLTITNDLTVTGNFAGLRLTNATLSVGGNITASSPNYGFSYVGLAGGESCTIGGSVTIGSKYKFRFYSDPMTATDINIGGSLVCTNGGRFYTYAGATNGAAGEYGMLISISNDVVAASNSFVCPWSHPTNGGSCLYRMTNFTILPFGGIDAIGAGYGGGGNYGSYTNQGFGPGGGLNAWLGSGGAYAGRGGNSASKAGGSPYGSAELPLQPGSGAGGRDMVDTSQYRAGSAGGGLVWIEANGQLRLDGSIRADGDTSSLRDRFGGGGSGGGVYLTCHTFASSNGLITVNGASGTTDTANRGGGGGGGRIALYYNLAAQAASNAVDRPIVYLAANHGPVWNGVTSVEEYGYPGEPGTIYLADNSFFPRDTLEGGTIIVPGVSAFTMQSLTISNSRAGFTNGTTVVVSNDVLIANRFAGLACSNVTLTIGGNLLVGDSTAGYTNFGYSYVWCNPGATFTVASNMNVRNSYAFRLYGNESTPTEFHLGSLTITNKGAFHLYAGMSNGAPDSYGGTVNISGDLAVAPLSWLFPYSHPSNGGSLQFNVGNVWIAAAGGISAKETGFEGGLHGINPTQRGYGPGGGNISGGGGYGGAGTVSGAGGTYGSSNAPVDAGSGGGGYNTATYGCRGGGSVQLVVSHTLSLAGTLSANGNRYSTHGGGSAGGSVHVRCKKFAGEATGSVTAQGGAASSPGGGGGGGRIAIWRTRDISTGAIATDVTGGGSSGTLVWGFLPNTGTYFVIR